MTTKKGFTVLTLNDAYNDEVRSYEIDKIALSCFLKQPVLISSSSNIHKNCQQVPYLTILTNMRVTRYFDAKTGRPEMKYGMVTNFGTANSFMTIKI